MGDIYIFVELTYSRINLLPRRSLFLEPVLLYRHTEIYKEAMRASEYAHGLIKRGSR